MGADTIVRLEITLDDVKPAVPRQIKVPLAIRLDRQQLAIEAAMGWTNSPSTRFAPPTWDGAFPIQVGAMVRLTRKARLSAC